MIGFGKYIGVGRSGSRSWTPQNFTATVISATEIDLTWEGTGNLSIERSTDGVTYVQIYVVASGINIFHDTGLTGGTLYYYRAQFVTTSATTYEAEASALFVRMIAASEEPTVPRKAAINTAIKSLKANGLFGTQFNALWVERNTGTLSSKMNWIQDAYNLTKDGAGTLTFTSDLGYTGDGSSTSLNCNIKPTTAGILGGLDDMSWGFKISGTITNNTGCGSFDNGAPNAGITLYDEAANFYRRCNNLTGTLVTNKRAVGYNCLTRGASDKFSWHVNADTQELTVASNRLSDYNFHFGALNNSNTRSLFMTETFEIGWQGKHLTQAKFLVLQTIMNTYIASL